MFHLYEYELPTGINFIYMNKHTINMQKDVHNATPRLLNINELCNTKKNSYLKDYAT